MKFNLSIDLQHAGRPLVDSADVAQALRDVADRLSRYASLPWSPYALSGKVYLQGQSGARARRVVGTWDVDLGGPAIELTITAENDPDSRQHCPGCGEHLPHPRAGEELCPLCARQDAAAAALGIL